MATIELAYGTNNQSITITLGALASAAFRAGAVVDNSTNRHLDALVALLVTTHASTAPSGDKAVRLWAYASVDGGSTFTDGVGGTDAGVTPTSPPNLRFMGSVNVAAANVAYRGGPYSVAAAFGGVLPERWGVVVENATGAALGASGHGLAWQGVEGQSV